MTATASDQHHVAWVSLDPNDNDSVSFWRYILTALQRIQPGVSDQTLALLNSPQPLESDTLIAVLVNEINTLAVEATLILDDYQAITNESIH